MDGALPSAPPSPVLSVTDHENAALFTGSSDALERSQAFAGPRDEELGDRVAEPAGSR